MRIDEFSNTTDIDGSISTEEITRFLLVGFDITIQTLVYLREIISLSSYILTSVSEDSLLCKTISKDSLIDLE